MTQPTGSIVALNKAKDKKMTQGQPVRSYRARRQVRRYWSNCGKVATCQVFARTACRSKPQDQEPQES